MNPERPTRNQSQEHIADVINMNKWLEDHPDTRAIRENHKRAIEENFFWYDSQLSKPRLVNEIGRRMLESQGSSVPPLRSHSQAMHEVDREYDELDGDER